MLLWRLRPDAVAEVAAAGTGWPRSSLAAVAAAAAAVTGSGYPGKTSCESTMFVSLHAVGDHVSILLRSHHLLVGELEGEVRMHGSPCRRSLRRSLRNASSSSLSTSTWVSLNGGRHWNAGGRHWLKSAGGRPW